MLHRQNNKFDELRRIVDIVAKARYKGSRRLRSHHWFSQITLTAASTALIVIPVLSLGGFNKNFNPRYVEVMQIIFAVLVLGYSLLLGLGNFALRSEGLHRCGLELSRLLRRMKAFEGKDDFDSEYEEFQSTYGRILDTYENHSNSDYQGVILDQKIRDGYPKRKTKKEFPELGMDESRFEFAVRFIEAVWDRWTRRFVVWSYHALTCGHYAITIVCIYTWLYMMFRTK